MPKNRVKINYEELKSLLHANGVVVFVRQRGHLIDAAASQFSNTKVDYDDSGDRPRVAVIAGYEDGATAENTRRVLLGSLDAAHD